MEQINPVDIQTVSKNTTPKQVSDNPVYPHIVKETSSPIAITSQRDNKINNHITQYKEPNVDSDDDSDSDKVGLLKHFWREQCMNPSWASMDSGFSEDLERISNFKRNISGTNINIAKIESLKMMSMLNILTIQNCLIQVNNFSELIHLSELVFIQCRFNIDISSIQLPPCLHTYKILGCENECAGTSQN